MPDMIRTILDASKSDPGLSTLVDEAREYAEMYLLAQKTQRGCDGMGELATVREEFRDVIDKVIQYCKDKKYIPEGISYDLDSAAFGIVKQEKG
jgi:hypothetical protein